MINLYKALLKAQAEIGSAVKDAKNPHFQSKYETLESVIEATKKPLNDNGLVVIHRLLNVGDTLSLCTMIVHAETAEFIESTCELILNKKDMQQMGSAQTYAKRQNLKALTNLPSEDDDANDASKSNNQTQQSYTPRPQYQPPAAPQTGDIGTQIITFGKKMNGRRYNEFSIDEHIGMLKWLNSEADKKGKPLTGSAAEYSEKANIFIKSTTPGFDEGESIPF